MQSFTARKPLLTTTSAFGLRRRRWSSQQCYLHGLCTLYQDNCKLIKFNSIRTLHKNHPLASSVVDPVPDSGGKGQCRI